MDGPPASQAIAHHAMKWSGMRRGKKSCPQTRDVGSAAKNLCLRDGEQELRQKLITKRAQETWETRVWPERHSKNGAEGLKGRKGQPVGGGGTQGDLKARRVRKAWRRRKPRARGKVTDMCASEKRTRGRNDLSQPEWHATASPDRKKGGRGIAVSARPQVSADTKGTPCRGGITGSISKSCKEGLKKRYTLVPYSPGI